MRVCDKVKPALPPLEPGVYMGVCVGVVDLGEQYSEYHKKYSNKVQFVWALPGETIEVDGKTEERQISRVFNFAAKKNSNLRTFISSWNSKTYSDEEFGQLDLFEQIGKACQLNVVLNDAGDYANVDGVMPIPKGFPAPVTKTAYFTWDMDAWDDAAFEQLPGWAQEKIKKSTQYQKDHAPTTTVEAKAPDAAAVCPI